MSEPRKTAEEGHGFAEDLRTAAEEGHGFAGDLRASAEEGHGFAGDLRTAAEEGHGFAGDLRTAGGVGAMSGPPRIVVGIAGGSGSGKTTLARGLVAALGAHRVALLCHDAYYRDRGELDAAARAALDYDVPDALDHHRFIADLDRLRRGETVSPPRYCFVRHRRLGEGSPVEPREVLIVEGVLLLHDADVRQALDLAIFVDAPGAVRLRRRLSRDTNERGRTAASVVRQFMRSVAPAHLRYVEPTQATADLVLTNTTRIEPLVEVAATLIRSRLDRQRAVVRAVGA